MRFGNGVPERNFGNVFSLGTTRPRVVGNAKSFCMKDFEHDARCVVPTEVVPNGSRPHKIVPAKNVFFVAGNSQSYYRLRIQKNTNYNYGKRKSP